MKEVLEFAALVLVASLAGSALWLIWDPSLVSVKVFGSEFVLLIMTGLMLDAQR